jgi:hypothetical protein
MDTVPQQGAGRNSKQKPFLLIMKEDTEMSIWPMLFHWKQCHFVLSWNPIKFVHLSLIYAQLIIQDVTLTVIGL